MVMSTSTAAVQSYRAVCGSHRDGQRAIVLLIFLCSPHSHCCHYAYACFHAAPSTLQNWATFRKPPGCYKCLAHCCECLHSDIRLHTLVQFQINSKLGKYYYLSYLLVKRQTESHIWVNMGLRELQTECCSVLCLQWLDTAA